jgi:hypothetical protein
VLPYYSSNRISISLKTKSASAATRASNSINQRLEDYWLGWCSLVSQLVKVHGLQRTLKMTTGYTLSMRDAVKEAALLVAVKLSG